MNAMTLEQLRDYHIVIGARFESAGADREAYEKHQAMARAIDAHLTAHAQMVEKVREVILELRGWNHIYEGVGGLADKLAAAIGDKP